MPTRARNPQHAVVNMDASESLWFGDQLKYVRSQTYDIKYPNLMGRTLVPVDNSVPNTVNTIEYRQYDAYGIAKIIASYADDLPRADVSAKAFTAKVVSLGDSYGYNIQELRTSRAMGASIDGKKAAAARKAMEIKIDDMIALGDTTVGIYGLLNQPNALTYTIPDGAAGGTDTKWTAKTNAEILADLHAAAQYIVTQTNQLETPNTIILPPTRYSLLSTTFLNDNQDMTLLQAFTQTNPYIKTVLQWSKLETAGASGVKRMVIYNRSPEVVEIAIPQEFEQFPEQAVNLELKVPCHARIGGVMLYYPLSLCYADDI